MQAVLCKTESKNSRFEVEDDLAAVVEFAKGIYTGPTVESVENLILLVWEELS